MKKKIFLRAAAILLVAVFLIPSVLCACDDTITIDGATLITFKSVSSYDYLKKLDGEKVVIRGWLASSSPLDGSYIFLMNLPLQNCPFCKPNTNELSNTIEVFPSKDLGKFEYTEQLVQVVGTFVVAPENEPFIDENDYSFSFKIVDAEYFLVNDEDSPELILRQRISESGIINDIYDMLNYLNFVCNWCTYTYNFTTGKDYLYPDDIEHFVYTDKAPYNYGYKDGYFEGLVSKVLKIDKENLGELVTIILSAKELAEKALSEIEKGNYSPVDEYTIDRDRTSKRYGMLVFGNAGRKQYKMKDASLSSGFEDIYNEFNDWFSGLAL